MEIKFDGKEININNAMYFEELVPVGRFYGTYVRVANILLEVKNNTEELKYIQECILSKHTCLIAIENSPIEYYLSTGRLQSFYKQLEQNDEKLWILFTAVDVKEVLNNGD